MLVVYSYFLHALSCNLVVSGLPVKNLIIMCRFIFFTKLDQCRSLKLCIEHIVFQITFNLLQLYVTYRVDIKSKFQCLH